MTTTPTIDFRQYNGMLALKISGPGPIPAEFPPELERLEYLEISHNFSTTAPPWLGRCEHLRFLVLKNMPRLSLPSDFSLPRLEILVYEVGFVAEADVIGIATGCPNLLYIKGRFARWDIQRDPLTIRRQSLHFEPDVPRFF